jgi:TRAP-type mannitol/chloroaromatic compound transport system permease large subunit
MDETFYFAYYKKNEHMILFVPIFVPKLNQWYIDNILWVVGMTEK